MNAENQAGAFVRPIVCENLSYGDHRGGFVSSGTSQIGGPVC